MKIKKKIMITVFIAVLITALIITVFSLNQFYSARKNAIDTLDQEYNDLYDYNFNTAKKDNEVKISWILDRLIDNFNLRISYVESNVGFIKNSLEEIYSGNVEVKYNMSDELIFTISDDVNYNDIKNELTMLGGIQSILKSVKRENMPGNIYYSTESGITIFDDYYENYNNLKEIDARSKDWYKNAVESKDIYWSEAYIDTTTGNRVLTCAMPVCDVNNNVKGVVSIDIFVDKFLAEIINDVGDVDEYIFMMNKDGTFLIGSEQKNANGLLDEEQVKQIYNYIISNIGNPVIIEDKYMASGIITDRSNLFIGALIPVEALSEHANNVGDRILATNAKILDSMNSKANVLIVFSAVIFVFSIIVSIIISDKLTRSIVKPISTLSEGAKKIGEGNLYYKIKINTNDELSDLADSFNNMTGELNKYIKELTAVMLDKERLETELDVAKRIQVSMLPTKFPPFPDHKEFDIIASMSPAKKVGGDFYDFFFVDEEHLAFDIADVSGKGVPAALFMGKAKALIKDSLKFIGDPSKALFVVNNQLCEDNDEGMFVTAFAGVLNIKTGELVYANAGHNPPLVYSKENEQYEYIKPKANFILAAMSNVKYKNESITLKKGERIFCYTDGVTEAMDISNSLYSEDRLLKTLNSEEVKNKSIQEVLEYVKNDIDKFSSGVQQADDITMLSIELK